MMTSRSRLWSEEWSEAGKRQQEPEESNVLPPDFGVGSVSAPSSQGRYDTAERASLMSLVCHHVWVDKHACRCTRTCALSPVFSFFSYLHILTGAEAGVYFRKRN